LSSDIHNIDQIMFCFFTK